MSAALSQQYATTVMISFIDELRTNDEFSVKTMILITDNCFIHMRPAVVTTLTEDYVEVIAFPPDTIQIFQALDVSLFGVLKKKKEYKPPLGSDNLTVSFI
jgi:hypothetical protein